MAIVTPLPPALCLVLAVGAPLPPLDVPGLPRGDVLLVQTRRARVPTPDEGVRWSQTPLAGPVAEGVRDLVLCDARGAPGPSWMPQFVDDEGNVLRQARTALAWAPVREAVAAGRLRVHAWRIEPVRGDADLFDPVLGRFRPVEGGVAPIRFVGEALAG